MPLILILRPLERFAVVGAELKRVMSLGQFMAVEGTVRSEQVESAQADLRLLAELCEQLRPGSLYARYADKKVFRHEQDFWATEEKTVRRHVKRMADRRLADAVRLSDKLDIPMLYAKDKKSPLHVSDRLHLESSSEATPVMDFCRHGEGTTYRLQLRINGEVKGLSDYKSDRAEHRLVVLTHTPGMFILGSSIYQLREGFSGQLLIPFVGKGQVEIPRKLENDYFHRFILKHVAHAEINAEGFDITDISLCPQPCLAVETAVNGDHQLSLRFRYDKLEYAADSESNGRVTLTEADGSFRFVRQLRDKSAERLMAGRLKEMTGAGPVERFSLLRTMIDWLRQYAPRLKDAGFDVLQPSDRIYYIGPLSVEQSDGWHGDWLQTDVTVVVEGHDGQLRIPFLDLRDTILRGEQEYMLPSGQTLLIPQEWLTRYADLMLTGMPRGHGFLRHRSQVASLSGHEVASLSGNEVTSPDNLITSKPDNLKATLRPYQQEGFRWLWQNFVAQTGCCLSDEMGLGKTLQTIALLLKYKETASASKPVSQPQPGMLFSDEEMQGADPSHPGSPEPSLPFPYRTSLVVAPASVVHNWRNELRRFAPSLSVLTYTGDVAQRSDKRKALMRWDVALTTYRTLLNDISLLAPNAFGIVVFDESQAFKTPSSQIHQAVAQLQALHRMALSGTPVENNLLELWSLMSVLNPYLLGDARSFRKSFVEPIARQMEESRRCLLRRLIAPYFLKRTKEQVLADLPERQDEVVLCPMTDSQTSRYVEELSKARNEWLDPAADSQHRQIHLLAAIGRLRQAANGEGKLRVVFDHLDSLRPTHHKVLIFSEYVSLLERVGAEMQQRGWQYALLTGQTQNREQAIERFQQSADCQFFLISLKAGGVGLNLTAADYVFLLDPWWNRSAEEQAIARAHRIGQQRAVFVYHFVSAGTLEEQILTLQDSKQSLIDSVMSEGFDVLLGRRVGG